MSKIPKMKKMPHANSLLKEIADNGTTTGAKAFSETWDYKIDDEFTFGDLVTNALEYSLNVPFGFFIIIDDERFDLVVDGKFNMDVINRIAGKTVIVKQKPKDVNKIDYIAAPGVRMHLLKTKSSCDKLVLKPEIKLRKMFISDGIEDPYNVTLKVKELKLFDIVELIFNSNGEYPDMQLL